jgi:short subunit dehydrogenase-like uncharacterized protein
MVKRFMVYGCTGTVGRKIIESVQKHSMGSQCILAGRNKKTVEKLQQEMKSNSNAEFNDFFIEPAIFSLSTLSTELDKILMDANISVFLNCAGPLFKTFRVLVDACVRNGISYLDFSGDFKEIEELMNDTALNKAAREKKIAVVTVIFNTIYLRDAGIHV